MRVNIPLAEIPFSESAISSRSEARIIDGYIYNDGIQKCVTKRPGYVSYSDDSSSNPSRSEIFSPWKDSSGNYWWVDSALSVWKNGTEGSTATNLYIKNGVHWAEDDTYIYLQGGSPSSGTSNSDYQITKSDGTLTELTDAQHPAKVSSTQVVPGVVNLDGYYCLAANVGTASRIYSSDLGDATAWTSTSFIAADLEPDKLVFIAKHKNHIVAFGTNSIQFFYDAGNATGSPFSKRQDIFHKVGLITHALDATDKSAMSTVASYGDALFFVGKPEGGAVGIFAMNNFQLQRISTPAIDYLLQIDNDTVIRGIATFNNKAFLVVQDDWANSYSLVYDISEGHWYYWNVAYVRGVHEDKAVVDGNPIIYTLSGVQDAGSNPTFTIITPKLDKIPNIQKNTSNIRKFCNHLSISADNPGSATSFNVSYSDDDYQNFSTARTLDINSVTNTLRGMGSFYERAHKLTYSGANNVKLYDLVLDIDLGID